MHEYHRGGEGGVIVDDKGQTWHSSMALVHERGQCGLCGVGKRRGERVDGLDRTLPARRQSRWTLAHLIETLWKGSTDEGSSRATQSVSSVSVLAITIILSSACQNNEMKLQSSLLLIWIILMRRYGVSESPLILG